MEEIKEKARALKNLTEEMLSAKDAEPFMKSNLKAIYAHITLLCIELGLDTEE